MASDPFGLLVVDKPCGPTSHDVVSRVRRAGRLAKVGHAGTLDPMASGVLVLMLGQATRLSQYLTASDKRYRAQVRFGRVTTTYDSQGKTVSDSGLSPDAAELAAALAEFVGRQLQTPPDFSAVKLEGQRAYKLARAGKKPEIQPRTITIHSISLLEYRPPDLVIDVECSSGTYLRSLAHDLGERLGSGAHLAGLRRLRAGLFDISEAVPLDELEAALLTDAWLDYVIPAADGLKGWPKVEINQQQAEQLNHGQPIEAEGGNQEMVIAVDANGQLIALLAPGSDDGCWWPKKVFVGRN